MSKSKKKLKKQNKKGNFQTLLNAPQNEREALNHKLRLINTFNKIKMEDKVLSKSISNMTCRIDDMLNNKEKENKKILDILTNSNSLPTTISNIHNCSFLTKDDRSVLISFVKNASVYIFLKKKQELSKKDINTLYAHELILTGLQLSHAKMMNNINDDALLILRVLKGEVDCSILVI